MSTLPKTRGQLDRELYAILVGEDIRPAVKTCETMFPKSRGSFNKLDNQQLEQLIQKVKEQYGNAKTS